jgi:ApbE superfamily uncharacterized protein (UPF0280 family)
MRYTQRFYRQWMRSTGLERFRIVRGQSDLLILCDRDLRGLALEALGAVRGLIEGHIARDAGFAAALTPHPVSRDAPDVVRAMAGSARRWNVGPMAGVAGAVAQAVGLRLLEECETVIVENGGDVFVRSARPVLMRLYAGEGSPFSDRIGFEVDASRGLGVCTSSSTVGPSLSLGRADAVVAIADDAIEADVAATALANRIQRPGDVDGVVGGQEDGGPLRGLIACAGDRIGLWGDLELRRLDEAPATAPSTGSGARSSGARSSGARSSGARSSAARSSAALTSESGRTT